MIGGGAMHKMHKNNNNSSKSPSGSWNMPSSSRIDTNRAIIPVPDCNCGLRTTMYKANTIKNHRRPFYTCSFHKNDPRNCGYFICLDEWEEIIGVEEVVTAYEKHLSRNDGREPLSEGLLDGREVGKGNGDEGKMKMKWVMIKEGRKITVANYLLTLHIRPCQCGKPPLQVIWQDQRPDQQS